MSPLQVYCVLYVTFTGVLCAVCHLRCIMCCNVTFTGVLCAVCHLYRCIVCCNVTFTGVLCAVTMRIPGLLPVSDIYFLQCLPAADWIEGDVYA